MSRTLLMTLATWMGAAAFANAATQYSVDPALGIALGADDNVLFQQNGSGDQVATATGRLLVRAHERHWHLASDLAVSALGYDDRQRVVPLGEWRLTGAARPDRTTFFEVHSRTRIADDPLALARIGLIAGKGLTVGYRTGGTWRERIGRAWDVATSVGFEGVRFFEGGTASDGDALGLEVRPHHRYSRRLSFDAGLEGRIFWQNGLLARSLALVPGLTWRIGRRHRFEVAAGPLGYVDDLGVEPMAVARARWIRFWRVTSIEVAGAHDLTVPSSRGGVLAGETAEALVRYGPRAWELRARAGFYRSRPTPRSDDGVNGYGLEAGVFRALGEGVWVGATALRFERLSTDIEPSLTRNAAWVRLEWTGARP